MYAIIWSLARARIDVDILLLLADNLVFVRGMGRRKPPRARPSAAGDTAGDKGRYCGGGSGGRGCGGGTAGAARAASSADDRQAMLYAVCMPVSVVYVNE